MKSSFIQKTAVARAVFLLKSSLSAVLSSFCYSHETHPECVLDSNNHGCLTLHFAHNGNERRAKSLKPTLSTADLCSHDAGNMNYLSFHPDYSYIMSRTSRNRAFEPILAALRGFCLSISIIHTAGISAKESAHILSAALCSHDTCII